VNGIGQAGRSQTVGPKQVIFGGNARKPKKPDASCPARMTGMRMREMVRNQDVFAVAVL